MAAELGPERTGGQDARPGHALAGRPWLAALPDELTAQRHVMTGLVEWCETWPLVSSLLVGCSLGRGAADRLSDIDAALGVHAESGQAGSAQVSAAEEAAVAALPELGAVIDVLRHQIAAGEQWVRRIFAQFADGTQLDLAVLAQAGIDARLRNGGAPDFVVLYQAAPAPGSPAPALARRPAAKRSPRTR